MAAPFEHAYAEHYKLKEAASKYTSEEAPQGVRDPVQLDEQVGPRRRACMPPSPPVRAVLMWCAQLDKPHGAGALTAYIKGAPERVLAKCTTYLKDGAPHPITDAFRAAYDEAYNVRTDGAYACTF